MPRLFPSIGALATLLAGAMSTSGCLAYKVIAAPVKVAGSAVVVTGDVATAAVRTTGKLAVSSVDAVGQIGSSGIDHASRLTQAGMVTFVDASTGTIVRVPWRDGMSLASASAEARVELGRKAVDLIRAGLVVATKTSPRATPVVSGDVVRLRS